LNQPLLGIRGLAEHILIGFQRGWNITEETIREKIQLIIAQTDRMSHVIEHTRMFARGADNCELLPVQVNESIKSCLGLIGAQLRFRGFVLNCDLAEDLPPVLANPFSLEEVFLNLINNARDALMEKMKPGRSDGSLEVFIRTRAETGEQVQETREQVREAKDQVRKGKEPARVVKIEIIDRGTGIPSDLMPKVFDTFFTTKDPDKGTGLGLSISKSIIESYQGTISIQSKVGAGTTVTITLPAMNEGIGIRVP
jgi:signal transduction histidine kinase